MKALPAATGRRLLAPVVGRQSARLVSLLPFFLGFVAEDVVKNYRKIGKIECPHYLNALFVNTVISPWTKGGGGEMPLPLVYITCRKGPQHEYLNFQRGSRFSEVASSRLCPPCGFAQAPMSFIRTPGKASRKGALLCLTMYEELTTIRHASRPTSHQEPALPPHLSPKLSLPPQAPL